MNRLNCFFIKRSLWILLLPALAACSPGESSYSTLAPFPETPTPLIVETPLQPTSTPLPKPTLFPSPTIPAVEEITPPTATPSTPTPILTSAASPTTQSTLPDEYYIRTISGHRQFFPLGCETSAAVDWAAYFGVIINEFEFQHKIPLSDNPDLGFVGNVQDPWGQAPPYSYGVHAGPIAQILTDYGMPSLGFKGYTLEEVKAEIAADRPVIAWVIGNVEGGVPAEYTDSQGNTSIVAAYEHVVIVTGYNTEHIRYMNNGRFYEAPNEIFLNSWGVLGNMVVIKANEPIPSPAP